MPGGHGMIDQLWAKAERDGSGRFHPLACHMLDVASVALSLWDAVLQRGLRHDMASRLGLPAEQAGRWIAFWAGLHDLGKACPAFQAKNADRRRALEAAGLPFPSWSRGFRHDHATARLLPDLLGEMGPRDRREGDEAVRLPRGLVRRVAATVGGHHGVFPRAADVLRLGSAALGTGRWAEARETLVIELAHVVGVDQLAAPTTSLGDDHAFFILLAGMTSVADWIGSCEDYFPYADGVVLGEYAADANARAKRALDGIGWADWGPAEACRDFRSMFGFPPRPLQCAAAALADEVGGPALIIIEAPMGEGKTEAALYLSRHWDASIGRKGCYVALPTRATSDQMFHRVREFLATQYPSQIVNLQLLHGRAALSEEFQQLRLTAIHDEEADEPGGSGAVVAEEWFTPKKRGLLAPFAVGTVDQSLLAVLQTRHAFVRLFGLAHKTVIIDEVHAYDTYMSTLLERLLEWLHALGCTVVMLSATLPAERRRSLLAASGSGHDAPSDVPYPRITWAAGDRSGAVALEAEQRLARDVRLRWVPPEPDALAPLVSRILAGGGCAVCICNTVGRAQKVYAALRGTPGNNECTLLHSRFPFEERDARERKVTTLFGKDNSRRPHRAVLVATQIVEQSLDVDFDLMVTELAPVDLVIQRAGRLHRHPEGSDRSTRQRPAGLEAAQLWVMKPDTGQEGIPDFGPTGYVYAPHTLLRSYLALHSLDVLRLPDDIERLVEAVYGEAEPEDLPHAWRRALEAAREELEREVQHAEWVARNNLIKPPDYGDDILEDFCKQLHEDDPSVHQALRALTRLAKPSVPVVCLTHDDGGLRTTPDSLGTVNLGARPALDQAKALLRRSLSVSHAGLVQHLQAVEVPAGWQRSALLRHHRPLVFDEGQAIVGRYLLRLEPDLGLTISRIDGVEEGGST